jgi:hypothetical protein
VKAGPCTDLDTDAALDPLRRTGYARVVYVDMQLLTIDGNVSQKRAQSAPPPPIEMIVRKPATCSGAIKNATSEYMPSMSALGLYLSLGFQHEGRIRRNYLSGGMYHDEILLGMTREEFDALHSE